MDTAIGLLLLTGFFAGCFAIGYYLGPLGALWLTLFLGE